MEIIQTVDKKTVKELCGSKYAKEEFESKIAHNHKLYIV